jgi:protoheme IX farnesyltransferase
MSNSVLNEPLAKPVVNDGAQAESWFSDLSALIKLRLSFLVVCTTLVGYVLGRTGNGISWLVMGVTLVGTALAACGASALNQWLEREWDARMRRTQNRPLPAGRMHSEDALLFGVLFSLLGIGAMAIFVEGPAAWLTLATVLVYVGIYTPLKRVTEFNTLIGAIPGAIPPLIGWTAATGSAGVGGWILFAILWFWQMPHFLAIAWMYRDDYRNAGFVMLTGRDEDGSVTGRQAVSYGLCLIPVSLLPAMIGLNNLAYVIGAFILGLLFLVLGIRFAMDRSEARARKLFLGSILYLPALLILLVSTTGR